jgi:hypothetical protein
MKTRTVALLIVLSSTSIVTAITLKASVPLGVYATVEKVVLEPSDAEPQRIQIWGAFALWDDKAGMGYQAAQRGYLYYSCAKQQIGICRNEWADLKSMIGTDQTIGFGSRSLASGRVRRHDEPPSAPDTYPIQFGVVRMGSPRGAIFDQLRAAMRGR